MSSMIGKLIFVFLSEVGCSTERSNLGRYILCSTQLRRWQSEQDSDTVCHYFIFWALIWRPIYLLDLQNSSWILHEILLWEQYHPPNADWRAWFHRYSIHSFSSCCIKPFPLSIWIVTGYRISQSDPS